MRITKIVNLTPHSIDLIQGGFKTIYPTSGQIARCEEVEVLLENLYRGEEFPRIPIYCKKMGTVKDLPDPEEGTAYIVSLVVAQALRGQRGDLLVPRVVRDQNGQINGCNGFFQVV